MAWIKWLSGKMMTLLWLTWKKMFGCSVLTLIKFLLWSTMKQSHRYLHTNTCGVIIDQQIIDFLRRLRSFGVRRQISLLFSSSAGIIMSSDTVTVHGTRVCPLLKSHHVSHRMKICSNGAGQPLEWLYDSAHHNPILALANNISETNHVSNIED